MWKPGFKKYHIFKHHFETVGCSYLWTKHGYDILNIAKTSYLLHHGLKYGFDLELVFLEKNLQIAPYYEINIKSVDKTEFTYSISPSFQILTVLPRWKPILKLSIYMPA